MLNWSNACPNQCPAATIERPSAPVGGDSARPSSALSRYFEISLYLHASGERAGAGIYGKAGPGHDPARAGGVAGQRVPLVAQALALNHESRHGHFPGGSLHSVFPGGFVVGFAGTLVGRTQNPALFGPALLSAIHLLLFAIDRLRLFTSASTTRDYLFLALAFVQRPAGLRHSHRGLYDLSFSFSWSSWHWRSPRSSDSKCAAKARKAQCIRTSRRARRRRWKLHTALGITSGVIAVASLVAGTVIFFVIPRFNAGYLSAFNLQPSLISGFSDDVEEPDRSARSRRAARW